MANIFNPSAAKAKADAQEANVTAQPVEAESDGEETQQEERRYTSSDMEAIVKDRLLREQKKFAKERQSYDERLKELEKQTAPDKANPSVEAEWQSKLAKTAKEKDKLAEQVKSYQRDSMRAKVERSLSQHECLDPEVAMADLEAKGLVEIDDDGELVIKTEKDLDALVKSYLSKKPHLVRAKTQGGVGTKQPKPFSGGGLTLEEKGAQLGVRPRSHSIFHRE